MGQDEWRERGRSSDKWGMSLGTVAPVRNAEEVWAGNVAALREVQPGVVVERLPGGWSACWGRDGTGTFRDGEGRWWKGCSVPRAASVAMLESLSGSAPVAVYLQPMHPAGVVEALRILGAEQVLIALLESEEELGLFLGCVDFSGAIRAHRLLFATSVEGRGGLAEVLAANADMPTPGLFVRTSHLTDEVVTGLIEGCQAVFGREHERRTVRVNELSGRVVAREWPARRVVVGRRGRFEVWNDGADVLAGVMGGVEGVEVVTWVMDDPLRASPVHLLGLAVEADGMVGCDFYRPDAQGILPGDFRLVTWATCGRIASYSDAGEGDLLLVADSELRGLARARGWPEEKVVMAGRPVRVPGGVAGEPGHVAMIGETKEIKIPAVIEDYSSHRLLWERVEAELRGNALRVGQDVEGYVTKIQEEMSISGDGFPMELIVSALVVPLWRQQVVRMLVAAGVGVKTYGRGWDSVQDLRATWGGEIGSQGELFAAVDGARLLLAPEPGVRAHPVDFAGRPVVRAGGDPGTFGRRVGAMVKTPPLRGKESGQALSAAVLGRALGRA